MSQQVRFINNITKVYPDMIQVIIYKEPHLFVSSDSPKKRKREEVDDEHYAPSISSLNRTKTLVRDLVLCNDFELFCTFTFDPKKCNSMKYGSCWLKMQSWLHNQKNRATDRKIQFKYLIIPEQHKSGRWHFHALISGYTGSMHDSGHLSKSGRIVYNLTSFRSGFTSAVEIDSNEGVSNYITKYITKDFIKTFNQRRFYCSRNLSRPEKRVNSPIFSQTLPLFRRKISENAETEEYTLPLFDDYSTNLARKRRTPYHELPVDN